jgi:zinc protease
MQPARTLDIGGYPVHEYTYDNGLRLLVAPRTSAPVCGIFRAVEAGSADEPGIVGRGVAHFIEHMDFRKQKGDKHDTWNLEKTRGIDMNAYTNQYMTGYHEIGHSDDWEVMLADDYHRYSNKYVPDAWLKTEMQAVLNEEDRSNDGPGQMWRAVSLLAVPNSNYGQETIGTREDIIHAKAADMTRFRETYYVPNNTTLIVAGNVDPAAVVAKVADTYGRLERGPSAAHVNPADPPQQGARTLDMIRPAPCTMFCLAYPGPQSLSHSSAAATVVQRIWQNREDAYVKRGEVHSTGMYAPRMRDAFMVVVHASVAGTDAEKAARVAETFKRDLHKLDPTQEELDRAKDQLAMHHEASLETVADMMKTLGAAAGLGDWTDAQAHADAVQLVTRDDVVRYCNAFLTPLRASLVRLVPGPMPSAPVSIPHAPQLKPYAAEASRAAGFISAERKATHVAIATPGARTAHMRVSLAFDPRDQTVADVLTKTLGNGCRMQQTTFSRETCAAQLAKRHAARSFTSDRGFIHASLRLPMRSAAAPAAVVVNGELLNPIIAEADVRAAVRNISEELNAAKDDPMNRAQRLLITTLYTSSPYDKSLDERVAELHRVRVGDVRALKERLRTQVAGLTLTTDPAINDTKMSRLVRSVGAQYRRPHVPWTPAAKAASDTLHATPGHASDVLMMGQTIDLAYDHSDMTALKAAVRTLGGGMSARLMSTIRGKLGLGTYGIYANVHATPEASFVAVHGTFAPQYAAQGYEAARRIIAEWTAHGITDEELASWQTSLKGPHALTMDDPGSLIDVHHAVALRGKDPQTEWDATIPRAEAVTRADVMRALGHLRNDAWVTVRMGQWPQAPEPTAEDDSDNDD